MNLKQQAAEAALPLVRDGMIVGLGTGTTIDFFIVALGEAIKAGKLRDIRAIPSSIQSQRRAQEFGIPLLTFGECSSIDMTVDGADEVDPQLNLIKGLGGALLREKIVAQDSRQLIIVVDESKVVDKLGSKAPLPVEVAQFGHEAQARFLSSLGSQAMQRRGADGKAFVTDNGNFIYDCRFGAMEDPRKLQETLRGRAGIVETGLFLGMATAALIASAKGVEQRAR
jgi:ribose 5-phosphate isomerase A